MRYALPLIYCVDEETQAKLLGMITDINSVPAPVWHEWPAPELIDFKPIPVSDMEKEYVKGYNDMIDKIMRQAPSRSRG